MFSGQEPSIHDAAVSFIASSIEIEAQSEHAKFISHLDILKNASREAQEAQSPLSIPIPELVHTLESGSRLL